MKIAYILHSTSQHGGATKSFMALLQEITRQDNQVIVVVPDRNGIYKDLQNMNVDVQAFHYRPAIYPWLNTPTDVALFIPRLIGRLVLNFWAFNQLATYLKKKGIDIIHTNVSVIDIGFKAAQKLNIPHIYHIREYADKDFKMYHYPCRKHFRHSLNGHDCYNICITKDIQRHYQQQGNPRSAVIYNGISSCKQPDRNFFYGNYFLFAGRIEKAKGVEFLIQAYSDYYSSHPKEALPLYIAGEIIDDHLYEKLKTSISLNHIQEKIVFLGARSDIRELMEKARAVVITSHFEAFGRCMPEAMSCKSIAIGRNTGGTLEQLENGKQVTGEEIALRFDTPSQLSERLYDATIMPEDQYCHMTESAWTTVKKLYSIESYVSDVLSMYDRIMSSKLKI